MILVTRNNPRKGTPVIKIELHPVAAKHQLHLLAALPLIIFPQQYVMTTYPTHQGIHLDSLPIFNPCYHLVHNSKIEHYRMRNTLLAPSEFMQYGIHQSQGMCYNFVMMMKGK